MYHCEQKLVKGGGPNTNDQTRNFNLYVRKDPYYFSDWQYDNYLEKMDVKMKEFFGRREMAEFYNTHSKTDHEREKCPLPLDMTKSLFDATKGSYRMQDILSSISKEKEDEEEDARIKKENEIKGE